MKNHLKLWVGIPSLSRATLSIFQVVATTILFAACQSTRPEFTTPDGPIKEMTPAAYRIVIGPMIEAEAASGPVQAASELHFTKSLQTLRLDLVKTLQDLETASFVGTAESVEEARQLRADIYVRPTLLAPITLGYKEMSDSWWSSWGLWLVTWIGGMYIDDATYSTRLAIRWEFLDTTAAQSLAIQPKSTGDVDLAFMERNRLFSWSGLQSLVLPPCLTSDDVVATSAALSERVEDAAAAQLAVYVKRELEGQALLGLGGMKIHEPENGSRLDAAEVTLRARVEAGQPPEAVTIQVNDGAPVNVDDLSAAPRGEERNFVAEIRHQVSLRPGENFIRIKVATAANSFARTMRLHRRVAVAAAN